MFIMQSIFLHTDHYAIMTCSVKPYWKFFILGSWTFDTDEEQAHKFAHLTLKINQDM